MPLASKEPLMKLLTNCQSSSAFFSQNKRIFLDSCVLNELAVNPEVAQLVKRAGQCYSTFVAAISLLEVGFGPTDKANTTQQSIALGLYTNPDIVKVNTNTIDTKDPINGDKAGKNFLYIPIEHEWFGARHKLVKWMDNEKTTGTAARKQANDALIYMCAWNANSFLITENVKDFTRFNRIMHKECGGHLPIFTIADLRTAQNSSVTFPDNIPNYPS
jgi:predicted nucleic acid-binding protein